MKIKLAEYTGKIIKARKPGNVYDNRSPIRTFSTEWFSSQIEQELDKETLNKLSDKIFPEFLSANIMGWFSIPYYKAKKIIKNKILRRSLQEENANLAKLTIKMIVSLIPDKLKRASLTNPQDYKYMTDKLIDILKNEDSWKKISQDIQKEFYFPEYRPKILIHLENLKNIFKS